MNIAEKTLLSFQVLAMVMLSGVAILSLIALIDLIQEKMKYSKEIRYKNGMPQKSEWMIENEKRFKRRRKIIALLKKLPYLRPLI